MKKNIVIKNGTLSMGGGEIVLLNLLKNLDHEKYNIFLFIDDENIENTFLDDIPSNIKVYFLRPVELVLKVRKCSEKKKRNILDKLQYNYYLWKNLKIGEQKCTKYLNDLREKVGEIDVFIDFNGGARKYINKLKSKRKIICRHLSMAEYGNKTSKISRYEKDANKYDVVVAVCNNLKKEMVKLLPDLEKKIKVLYNPIDLDRIKKEATNFERLTSDEKNLLEEKYILTISRLDHGKKDYRTLIEGYSRARLKGFNYKLYIIGDGPGRKNVEDIIEEHNLKGEVILLGMKKNPYVWLKSAEFFILSSKEEGFGLVLIEAMCLKKAVISSNCPVGPSEILDEGKYGLLFEVGNSIELADKILSLSIDRTLIKKYEDFGFTRAKYFDLETSIKEYEKIIDDLCGDNCE